jgi:hypothetical protein
MATSEITESSRIWNEDYWFPATGWWYRRHTVETKRTVGYTDYATAETAAGVAVGTGDGSRGKVATVNRDAPGLYSFTIETDTIGELTIYDPQPT